MAVRTNLSPFTFVNAVSHDKTDIFNEETEKQYLPFIVNRTLSYHADAVLAANLMNRYWELPKRPQFAFYLNTLRPRKRFAKWAKKENDETVMAVSQALNVSERDAKIALRLLSEEQLEQILEKNIGGVNNER